MKPFNTDYISPGTPVIVKDDDNMVEGIIDFYSVHQNEDLSYWGEVYLVGIQFPYEPSEVFLKNCVVD